MPLRILLALLVAAFTACVTGEPEVAGFLLEDFPAAGEPPRVVLVDAGTGEKSELRYLIAAGSVHEMVMTTSMRMSNPQGQELQAPGTRAVMVVEVVEADAERVQLDTSILSEPELVGTEGAPPELVAIMRQALRGMSSFRGRITMNRRGFAEESDFQVDTQDPMLQQFFESMKQSMSQLAIPFPEEAVGVGARWKMLQRMADPVTLYQVMSFELLGREGSSLTLAMKVTQLTPRQTLPLPQTLPGAPVDLSAEMEIEGSGEGEGEIALDLHSPVPRSRMSVDSTTTTSVRIGDEVRKMAMNMAMLMEVEPRGLEGAEETPPVGAGSRP